MALHRADSLRKSAEVRWTKLRNVVALSTVPVRLLHVWRQKRPVEVPQKSAEVRRSPQTRHLYLFFLLFLFLKGIRRKKKRRECAREARGFRTIGSRLKLTGRRLQNMD